MPLAVRPFARCKNQKHRHGWTRPEWANLADHGLLASTRSPAPESQTRQGLFKGRWRPVAEERPVFLRRSAEVSVEGRSNRGRGAEPGKAAKVLDWLGGRLQYLARSID